MAALSAQVARLSKDSATSSRPRSSDITKPPKSPAPAGGPRRIGGQPGHARHERKAGRRAPPRGEAQDLADGP
jgi:hypothetical protein